MQRKQTFGSSSPWCWSTVYQSKGFQGAASEAQGAAGLESRAESCVKSSLSPSAVTLVHSRHVCLALLPYLSLWKVMRVPVRRPRPALSPDPAGGRRRRHRAGVMALQLPALCVVFPNDSNWIAVISALRRAAGGEGEMVRGRRGEAVGGSRLRRRGRSAAHKARRERGGAAAMQWEPAVGPAPLRPRHGSSARDTPPQLKVLYPLVPPAPSPSGNWAAEPCWQPQWGEGSPPLPSQPPVPRGGLSVYPGVVSSRCRGAPASCFCL